jgi:glycosyltransferase involved in cell wall biosynthesis
MSKVSVIVPVHNTVKYIDTCVRSLRQQTLKDIEIILVENASDDGSLERCHELASADERIKVIHSDIGDLSHARNLGIECATSEYVAFVDSDDTVAGDMYQVL